MSGLPKRFPDRDEIDAVRAEAEAVEPDGEAEETRRLAGRVMARRDLGKLVFLDLVDRSGRIQLLVQPDRIGDDVDVDLGDVIGVTGKPAKSRRGEPSLAVDRLELLAKTRRPLPDTFHGVTDVETRYRQRYLDLLMSDESRGLAIARTRIVAAVRGYLDEEGFLEVETPILQPRYGGGFAEPFVTHSNELDADLYLRIADELYLKRLIVGGLEKVYELSKDFRNESISYKHSPEFTQVEWYEAYADYRDTMERTEALVLAAAKAVGSTRASPSAVTTSTFPRRGSASASSTPSRPRASGRETRSSCARSWRRPASTPAVTARGRSSSTTRTHTSSSRSSSSRRSSTTGRSSSRRSHERPTTTRRSWRDSRRSSPGWSSRMPSAS